MDLFSSVTRTEVAVVGASIAGLTTALCLARRGRSVLVIDRGDERRRPGEVLSPNIKEVLAELGLWEPFLAEEPIASAGVTLWWGSVHPTDWDYMRNPYNVGWHIDRARFVSMLRREAVAAGAALTAPCTTTHVLQQPSAWKWCLRGTSSPDIEARFLVHAAGRSPVLSRVGSGRVRWDQLAGLCAYHSVSNAEAAEPRLWVEATRDGWWYTAPLPGGRLIAAFMTDSGTLQRPFAEHYRARLDGAPATAARLKGATLLSEITPAPCETGKLRKLTQPAFVAVGDAAYSVDPLCGRGIIKAMRMAMSASVAVDETLAGREESLGEYDAHWENEFKRYLAGLPVHYRNEQRWPETSFWRSRHHPPTELSGSPHRN